MAPAADVGVDRGVPAVVLELDRVEEALDQADVVLVEVRVEAVDRLREHGVAEPIHHVRELGDDRGIDRDVEAVRHQERIDLRLDLAREFLEHEMLVFHLGDELRGLEEPLAVPDQCVALRLCRRECRDIDSQPFVEESQIPGSQHDVLSVLDQPVVFRMEHVVNRRQADVLVRAAVARDVVRVEQLVVVLAVGGRIVRVAQADLDVAVGKAGRHRVVSDVGKEGVPGAQGALGQKPRRRAFDETRRVTGIEAREHQLHEAVRAGNEIAVLIRCDQRNVADVGVDQADAERKRLRLDVGPGRHAAVAALDELACCDRIAIGVERVLAQEHLVRRVGGVGLVLVDERRGRVDGSHVVRGSHDAVGAGGNSCARQHHEVGRARGIVQRVVRLQRNEHGAAAALADEIEAVIEELAEQREPGIERCRQAFVRRDVRDHYVRAVELDARLLEQRVERFTRLGKSCLGSGAGLFSGHRCSSEIGVVGIGRRRRGRGRRSHFGGGERIEQRLDRLEGGGDLRRDGHLVFRRHDAGTLKCRQDRGRVAERLVDDEVRDGSNARIDDDRIGIVGGVVVRRRGHRRACPRGRPCRRVCHPRA